MEGGAVAAGTRRENADAEGFLTADTEDVVASSRVPQEWRHG